MTKQAIITLVQQYVQKVKAHDIPVDQVIVFGSQIKGKARAESDIDTCIVSPLFGKNRHDERLRLMKLASGHFEYIEPHPYSPEDLNNKFDPLANEIRKTGQPIDIPKFSV